MKITEIELTQNEAISLILEGLRATVRDAAIEGSECYWTLTVTVGSDGETKCVTLKRDNEMYYRDYPEKRRVGE